jgi:hypothetical protein
MDNTESISPLVSIIIPNWNGKHLLKPCLDSVINQTFKDFEIIVVDCNSSDGSSEFIEIEYPSVKLIKLIVDRGPANAINQGCRASNGKYVLILNNDVILDRVLIDVLIREINWREEFVINPIELDWDGKFRAIGCYENWISVFLYIALRSRGETFFYPSTACCLTTKKLLMANPLNEDIFMYEDTEWGWRLQLLNVPMLWTSKTFFLHKGSGSADNPFSPKKAYYVGLSTIATCSVCLKYPTILILLPFLLMNYIRHCMRFVRRGKYQSLLAYNKGIFAFWDKAGLFRKKRGAIQASRKVGDWVILRRAIHSVGFARLMAKSFGGKCVND